jgi:predicted site-specific integrase-resolvase
MEKKLISAKELLYRYGISKGTLRKWVRELQLPIMVMSDKKKFADPAELQQWEESMKQAISKPPL